MLFETEDIKPKPVAVPDDFSGTDEQVRRLIATMSDESKKVTDEDFPQPENPDGFEPKGGKLLDEGMELSARGIVSIGDKLISFFAAQYAMDDPENFYADESDLIEISEPLEHYFKENKKRIPPWAIALGAALMVGFKKFALVSVLRQRNLELKEHREQSEFLKREIERLKHEKEIKQLKEALEHVN